MRRPGRWITGLTLLACAAVGLWIRLHKTPPVVTVAAARPSPAPVPRIPPKPDKSGFYLRDGDCVLFLGDSITEQRHYTTYIETYCVTRFPKKRFTFITSGKSGDRTFTGQAGPIEIRLERDVAPHHPTVVVVCLGMNDGDMAPFAEWRFDKFVKGYRRLLKWLKKAIPDVRITLLTPPAYDDITRPPKFPGGYNAALRRFGQEVKALAKEYGALAVEVNAPLVAALAQAKQKKGDLARKLIPDRVHPSPGGHLIIAAAVLKAWKAPATVADIAINAARHRIKQEHSTITNLRVTPKAITFTQTDAALPWPIEHFAEKEDTLPLALAITESESHLNRYQLKVTGLKKARYALRVDNTPVGVFTRKQLSEGVNLAELPLHPANVQAAQVLQGTRRHNDLYFRRWRRVWIPYWNALETRKQDYLQRLTDLDAEEAKVVAQQRDDALPKPRRVALIALRK